MNIIRCDVDGCATEREDRGPENDASDGWHTEDYLEPIPDVEAARIQMPNRVGSIGPYGPPPGTAPAPKPIARVRRYHVCPAHDRVFRSGVGVVVGIRLEDRPDRGQGQVYYLA